jgi:phage terminase large subunit GpA-like protein
MAVDSGYNTSEVYAFCRRYDPSRVVPTKGQEAQSIMVSTPRAVDVSRKGKPINGIKVRHVGISIIKSELYGWLRLQQNEDGTYPNGYCHFPQYDAHYFKGLTAERLELKKVRGFDKYMWVKKYERNEPLDCRVYARAAANMMGMDNWKEEQWKKILLSVQNLSNKKTKIVDPEINPITKKKKRSSFWD